MAREGLQFTQDRLKAGSWRCIWKQRKSSSVSANAAGFCACERSAIFVALRCTSGAGANRNRQRGTGNQGQGRGDKKANGISAANPHPPPQTPQTVCRGAVYPSRRKKTGTVRRKPAIPPTRRPPRRKQAHAKQIIAQKQENATKKANFAAKLRSVCAENHKHAVKVYKRDRCQKENQE